MNTQVDALSTHFYSSCNQLDPDVALFNSVPGFTANVQYFYQELQTRPDLAKVPVWVTESNVNADYSNNGFSQCNPGQTFVTDERGTSAFFAAWRPYVFSQLGKAGNRALFQWAYPGDQQYGEVDSNGNTYLSYWVDKALANFYPSTPSSPGPSVLTLTTTDASSMETLATRNSNGTVTVMVVNHTVDSPTDNNGKGVPRTVVVDTSSLGGYYSESLMTIDATTSATTGPAGKGITPNSRTAITLQGYGVAFLTLTP